MKVLNNPKKVNKLYIYNKNTVHTTNISADSFLLASGFVASTFLKSCFNT